MFKYLILALSLFLVVSCSDSSSDSPDGNDSNLGKEGYNCNTDKTCDTSLICNRNDICEKEVIVDNSGREGYECKADKVCNTDLVCNDQNICEKLVDEHLGEENYACRADKTCDYDLFCNSSNICEKKDVIDYGKEGKPCIIDGRRCLEDYLVCSSDDICVAFEGDTGAEGNPCKADYSCNAGLMCALENVCMNVDDFNTGDEGQKCKITDDSFDWCYEGFSCDTFGRCELDCSPGNDSLCTSSGEFDLTNGYASKYKLIRFDETTECGTNNYEPIEHVLLGTSTVYDYFELTYVNNGLEYLAYHTCESATSCSSSEKAKYRIFDEYGEYQTMMEFGTINNDGSCTYLSISSKIRKVDNKVRIRYTFDSVTVDNYTDECSDANVSDHFGEMECSKIRIIDGIKEF